MIAAALGYIAPVQGALPQETIDVSAILNALQALGESQTYDTVAKQGASIL